MPALLPGPTLSLLGLAVAVAGTAYVVLSDWNKAYGLGLVVGAVYTIQVVDGVLLSQDTMAASLGLVPGVFLEGAQWWAPFTYMFVHSPPVVCLAGLGCFTNLYGSVLHVGGNLFILLTAGPPLEERIGSRAFLATYFGAGLLAGVAHLGFASYGIAGVSPGSPAVGASGAIFGVLTLFAMLYPREEIPFPMFIIIWLPSFVVLLVYLGMNIVYIFTSTSVAWYGHFAGFVGGLAASTRIEARGGTDGGAWAVDPEVLRPLATTERLREILGRIEQVEGTTADDETWTRAWLERFADAAECPRCGGNLRLEDEALVCEEGDFRRELEERHREDDG